jgi:hypothetical protein
MSRPPSSQRTGPGGVDSVKYERASGPPGPRTCLVEVAGGLALLCSANTVFEPSRFAIPIAGCPTAWESGFEQTPAGTLGSWMAKAGAAGTARATATITPAIKLQPGRGRRRASRRFVCEPSRAPVSAGRPRHYVATTSRWRLALEPRTDGALGEMWRLAGGCRRPASGVVFVVAACHAGGRRFESGHSRLPFSARLLPRRAGFSPLTRATRLGSYLALHSSPKRRILELPGR